MPIPAEVSSCLERALQGTYEAAASQLPFPAFTGEVPVRLSWSSTVVE
jgi:hypothetical protein